MKFLSIFVWLLLALPLSADSLGNKVQVKPVAGWELSAKVKPVPFPTLRYGPADGRNAAVLLTLFPAAQAGVTNLATLKLFHRKGCTPFVRALDTDVPQTEVKLPGGGVGVFASFEDPSLVGKPPQRENYKWTTSFSFLLGDDALVQATIFSDDTTTSEFKEALAIIRSMALVSQPAGSAQTGKFKPSAIAPSNTTTLPSPTKTGVQLWGGKWDDRWPVFIILEDTDTPQFYWITYKWIESKTHAGFSSQRFVGEKVRDFVTSYLLILKVTGNSGMVYGKFENPRMANLVRITPPTVPSLEDSDSVLEKSGWKPGFISAYDALHLITDTK